jgi:AhpD family alkylhydroperoxidase
MNTDKIDPSLTLLKELGKITKNSTEQINKMRQQHIFSDGIVSAKHKVLSAMIWSIATKCEPCIKYYVLQAKKLGVSVEELGEYLAVASTMGGCVGEMWALKAFAAFKGDGETATEGDLSCCK